MQHKRNILGFLNIGTLYKILITILFVIVFFGNTCGSESMENRFFLIGNNKLDLKNEKTGREIHVNLFNSDGSINESARSEVDEAFGLGEDEKEINISLRLIFMLDYFTDLVAPGKLIHLVSGYRSPVYNKKLRDLERNVAPASTHMDGMALDFYIEGIEGKKLWEIIRKKNCCGVGYYGGKSIHLDSGRPRFWEAATSKTKTGESDYNRRMYLATEYDRYNAGDKLKFYLTSVSNFGFGIKKMATIVRDGEGEAKEANFIIDDKKGSDCISVNERSEAQSLFGWLSKDLPTGKYRIIIDFCKKPFDMMPSRIISNEIEVVNRDQYFSQKNKP